MNWLETLVQMPVSEALGWTVLHSLWQGSALAAVLAVVLATTRSPRIRYVAASVALLALAGCFAVTLLNLLPPPGSGPHGRLAPLTMPLTANRFSHSGAYSLNSLIPWLAPAWLIGACLSYLRYAAAWLSTSRLRTRAACQAPARWQARLSDLAREVKISRPVVLLESLFAGTPMVLGHFRPVILTPLGFLTALPPDQVEAVLLHELAHIARCDYLANVFQRLLEGLFFYHPAAWWVARILRQEREHCCDDLVVCWRGDPYTYAATLAQLETYRQQNWPARDTAVAAKGGNLMKRITRLLYPKAPGSVWAPIVATVVLLTSGGALIAGYHAAPQSAVANTQAYWQNWLNQDVAYIIDDQEKAAFERLTTDAERQHFVEQFWERRNPTPGASENAFKVEHYRRLAYANQHFASAIPGYQTDRGHIYIVYGPPDEIDAHPHTGNKPGVQTWTYHSGSAGEGGVFTFVDRDGTNDYRFAPTRQ